MAAGSTIEGPFHGEGAWTRPRPVWLLRKPGESYTAVPRPKLLDQVREAIRTRHMSPRTEEAYVH